MALLPRRKVVAFLLDSASPAMIAHHCGNRTGFDSGLPRERLTLGGKRFQLRHGLRV
jgi:hypothetical protein